MSSKTDAFDIDSLIGMEEIDALRYIKEYKYPHRIVERDGVLAVVPRDYNISRLNLKIQDGIVVSKPKFG